MYKIPKIKKKEKKVTHNYMRTLLIEKEEHSN